MFSFKGEEEERGKKTEKESQAYTVHPSSLISGGMLLIMLNHWILPRFPVKKAVC